MKRVQENKYGYLGWSWSGNGANLGALDIAQNFNASTLTSSSSIASSKPANSASSAATTSDTCNWCGTPYPMCTTTSSGWGWENSKSSIAA